MHDSYPYKMPEKKNSFRHDKKAPMRAAPISTEARKTPFDQEETIPN